MKAKAGKINRTDRQTLPPLKQSQQRQFSRIPTSRSTDKRISLRSPHPHCSIPSSANHMARSVTDSSSMSFQSGTGSDDFYSRSDDFNHNLIATRTSRGHRTSSLPPLQYQQMAENRVRRNRRPCNVSEMQTIPASTDRCHKFDHKHLAEASSIRSKSSSPKITRELKFPSGHFNPTTTILASDLDKRRWIREPKSVRFDDDLL